MADYQSLLTRAVANLPSMSSAATRQAIYDRARKALLTQLRTLRPPLPESDIAREEKALDQAIALVEAKFGATELGSLGADPPRPPPTPRRRAQLRRQVRRRSDLPLPLRPAQAAPTAPARAAPPPIPQRQPAARPPDQQTPPRPAPTRPIAPPSAPQNLNAAPTRPAPTFRSGSANLPETRAARRGDAEGAPHSGGPRAASRSNLRRRRAGSRGRNRRVDPRAVQSRQGRSVGRS